jgi:hypothetical protein
MMPYQAIVRDLGIHDLGIHDLGIEVLVRPMLCPPRALPRSTLGLMAALFSFRAVKVFAQDGPHPRLTRRIFLGLRRVKGNGFVAKQCSR